MSQVWSEGAVDVRLKFRKVDLHHLVVGSTLVRGEHGGVLLSQLGDALPVGGHQVVPHAVVEGEN